ncbi:MAG: sugar transferase [Gemmataceae bacterium]|nr:sugar transferase [Gemmataceae bacterium]
MATVSEPRSDAPWQPAGSDEFPIQAAVHADHAADAHAAAHAKVVLPAVNGVRKHLSVPAAVGSEPDVLLPHGSWYRFVKDGLDRVVAFLMLLVTSPLILAAMALVKLTSRGPALYSQARVGRHGRLFTIYKIRSMVVESESLTGACWSLPGDKRITRVGRWLRRAHIDELPQLWNVLLGDMSLVGPRPERPEFVPALEQAIPNYRDRLLVRPGITGFAQVQLPPDTGIDSVRTKLAYDLHYVQAVSFWFDVRICWATAFKMAGASFRFLARLFRFPGRAAIEGRYHGLAAHAQRTKAHTNGTRLVNPLPVTP